jgi:hypothetical protein
MKVNDDNGDLVKLEIEQTDLFAMFSLRSDMCSAAETPQNNDGPSD